MPSSAILDVAIGIAYIYLFLGLVCSVVNEAIAAIFSRHDGLGVSHGRWVLEEPANQTVLIVGLHERFVGLEFAFGEETVDSCNEVLLRRQVDAKLVLRGREDRRKGTSLRALFHPPWSAFFCPRPTANRRA